MPFLRRGALRLPFVACLFAIAVAGCSRYEPPSGVAPANTSATINAGFDQAWSGMIDYVAGTNFSIENFEKDSGLMILSFGGGDISRYVDCGTWQKDQYGLTGTMPYAARDDLRLGGQMYLRLRPGAPNTTDVRITTRYVLRNRSDDVWEFTSDRPATVRVTRGAGWTPRERTCRSTQAAEREMVDRIRQLSGSL